MPDKKSIIENELIKEIISIRMDTLWKMIGQKLENRLPAIDDEGATGKFDNKGAIFIPGGLVYKDVDEQIIRYNVYGGISRTKFREKIRAAMHFDNATLLYPNGLATSINLDSGFFSKAARQILTYKKAAFRRKKTIGHDIAREVSAYDIIRSHCPPYMKPPYGARTRISTCISIGLVDPPMFFAHCRSQYNLSEKQTDQLMKRLDQSIEPAVNRNDNTLFPPFVIVCHDTRYKKGNYTGLTRILGIGKFGEFATLTLEKLTNQLAVELRRKKLDLVDDDLCATYAGSSYVVILRIYASTNPGKRSHNNKIYVISPQNDLGLNTEQIEKEARHRYRVP